MASAVDGRVIQVTAPAQPQERVGFLARLEDLDVTAGTGGRQGRYQRAHRLGGDEPGGQGEGLRGGARQSVGGDQHAADQ